MKLVDLAFVSLYAEAGVTRAGKFFRKHKMDMDELVSSCFSLVASGSSQPDCVLVVVHCEGP